MIGRIFTSVLVTLASSSFNPAHAGVDITTYGAALSDHYGAWATCNQIGFDFPFADVDDSDYCACRPATPVFVERAGARTCIACGSDSAPAAGKPADNQPCVCNDKQLTWARLSNSCR